jgi:cytoskeletal protein CcmA (bactofilin family)
MNAEAWNLRRWGGLIALALVVLLPRVAGAQSDPEAGPGAPLPPTAVESVIAVLPEEPAPPAGATVEPDRESRSARRRRVSQMVEVGGSAVVRTNQVAEGVVVVRGDARIDGDVDGDVVVVLGNVRVRGHIRGDLVVVMGEAELDGRVDGDVALVLTRSRIGAGADLRGELVAAGVAPEVDSAARMRHEPEIISFGPLMRYFDWAKDYLFQGVFLLRPFPPGLGWVWVVAALCLALNLLVGILFPGALRGCMDTLRERPARSFLVGLLTCVLVGPVSLLLSFAVVATPLIWLAYFALCVFGRVAVYGAAGGGCGSAARGHRAPVRPGAGRFAAFLRLLHGSGPWVSGLLAGAPLGCGCGADPPDGGAAPGAA